MSNAFDVGALLLGVVVAALITGAVAFGQRGEGRRRVWIVAGIAAAVLMAAGVFDLLREEPRETHLATVFIGIPLPVLGAVLLQRAMRRVRPWIRWAVVFLVTLALLFVGLLIGGAIAPRFLGA
jgi:Na+/phosphate symporter